MKIIVKKISTMLIVGLVVTIAVYPMLHELGHSIVAILFALISPNQFIGWYICFTIRCICVFGILSSIDNCDRFINCKI